MAFRARARHGARMLLPIADPWYGIERLDERTFCLTEPHVHPIFSANIFLVLGRDADLVIDSGMGVAPLRPVIEGIRANSEKPLWLFTTHAHVDHIGGAHEFDVRFVHPLEAEELAAPPDYSLASDAIPERIVETFVRAGYAPLWPRLIDAVPCEGYDPDAYNIKPAPATKLLTGGDIVDLGDWSADVLHLPGHSPGQIGLWQQESGILFGADAIYDGPLLYDGPGMDVLDYADTLRKLRDLPIRLIYGGHDPAFGRIRFDEIVTTYLEAWSA